MISKIRPQMHHLSPASPSFSTLPAPQKQSRDPRNGGYGQFTKYFGAATQGEVLPCSIGSSPFHGRTISVVLHELPQYEFTPQIAAGGLAAGWG